MRDLYVCMHVRIALIDFAKAFVWINLENYLQNLKRRWMGKFSPSYDWASKNIAILCHPLETPRLCSRRHYIRLLKRYNVYKWPHDNSSNKYIITWKQHNIWGMRCATMVTWQQFKNVSIWLIGGLNRMIWDLTLKKLKINCRRLLMKLVFAF